MPELWTCVLGTVEYRRAVELQEQLRARVIAGELPDLLLLLEHPPVYTLGRRSESGDLPFGEDYWRAQGIDVVRTQRGGKLTYHGPGQLVGYPILRLRDRDTHGYLRRLEGIVIRALADYGLEGWHHPQYTGVWVGERKISAIGVKFSSGWITSHGFALNVSTDLSWFDRITPCGIREFGVTSLERELGLRVPMAEVERRVVERFREAFG